MSNMSYCRFQNTLPDLRDCYENLSDVLEMEFQDDLGDNDKAELRNAKRLIKLCHDIAQDYEVVD